MTGNYRRAFFLLILATATVLVAGLGLRDPWPADEPRFALIARDMVEGGNWLLPNVGGVLYPDKPPMHLWSVAALYQLTGSLRFSFLFPAIIAGLGTLALIVDLGRRLWGEAAGIWSGAILLSLIQFPLQMKSGQLDGPLCFWTTLSLYGLARHLMLGPDWRWYAVGGAAAGFGIITKGVGFLPYLIFLPYWIASCRAWELPKISGRDWRWVIAPIATLAAVSVWLIPMLVTTGTGDDPALVEYRNNILFHQTVTRYTDSWGHIKPPWYLLTNAAPWLWLPATALLPWLTRLWWRDIVTERHTERLLLAAWVLLVLIFFSLSDGKRSVYIFPAAPAFALIVGCYMPMLSKRASVRRLSRVFTAVLGSLIVAVAMYGLMHPNELHQWIPETAVIIRANLALLVTGIASLVAGLVLAWRFPLRGVAASLAVVWIGLSLFVAPELNETRSGAALVKAAQERTEEGRELGVVGWSEQFLLYFDEPVTHFGYRRDSRRELSSAIQWLVADRSRQALVARRTIEPCLAAGASPERVGRAHRREWLLVGQVDVSRRCILDNTAESGLQYRYSRSRLVASKHRATVKPRKMAPATE